MDIIFNPIGFVHSPFTQLKEMPRQPKGATGVTGQIELLDEYVAGLKSLEEFSHIIVLFKFHRSTGFSFEVNPARMMDVTVGVFASRSPSRPNAIGLSVVELEKVEGNLLHIGGHDMVDGTPVIDIKPYLPIAVSTDNMRFGWLEKYRRS